MVSALSSSLTFIVPISAANAAPERPASRIAVISGPSSRRIDKPTRSATNSSAPNWRIGTADWNARMMPSRNEMSATIGNAFTPTCSQVYQTSFHRTLRRIADREPQRGTRFSDKGDLRLDVAAR